MKKFFIGSAIAAALSGAVHAPTTAAAAELASPTNAQRVKSYSVYAPPLVYGNWTKVGSHIGRVAFAIDVTPIGGTRVFGQVKYYVNGRIRTEDFTGSIVIQTGNDIASIRIRLKGVPLGSACRVTVTAR